MAQKKYANVTLVVIIICLCFMFAGCESESEKTAGNKDLSRLIGMPEPETITIAIPRSDGSLTEDVINEINARTRKALNLTVEFDETYPASPYDHTHVRYAFKNRNFDAIVLMFNFEALAYDDLLMDITELFPQHAPKLYSYFPESELNLASYNDKLLAVPYHGFKTGGLYYAVRSDIAERCGITHVSSIRDVETALAAIKRSESMTPLYGGNLYDYVLMDNSNLIYFDFTYRYRKDDPAMQLHPLEQFKEYSEASETFKRWKSKGYFNDSGLKDTASFIAGGTELIDYYRRGLISGEYEIFDMSSRKEDKSALDFTMYGIAINKSSRKPEHVLKFLEWIYSDRSNYDLIMYGIEGENYTLKNDSIIPDEEKGLLKWYGREAFLNCEFERLYDSDPEPVKELYSDISDSSNEIECVPHFGFIPDLSKIGKKLNEIRNSTDQFFIRKKVFEGTSDMEMGEYIQYQKDLGADEIAKELQNQLDAWLKKNKK